MTKEQEAIKELKDNGFTVVKKGDSYPNSIAAAKGETATLQKLYQKK